MENMINLIMSIGTAIAWYVMHRIDPDMGTFFLVSMAFSRAFEIEDAINKGRR